MSHIELGPASTKPLKATIVLANSWVPFGAPHDSPSVYRTSGGMLVLDGAMKGGAVAAGTRVGDLPAGFRPPFRARFQGVNAGGATVVADLYAEPAGGIYIATALPSSTILSLSGVIIPAA